MAENIKKYTDAVKKTISTLSATTDSIEGKIKELVVVLEAVNNGLLTTETQVKGALSGVAQGKFENKAVLQGYLQTLQVADDTAKKIVDSWEQLRITSEDTLKQSSEYSQIQRDLKINFEDEFKIKKDIADNEEEQVENIEKKLDLVEDLVKKYKEFTAATTSNGSQLKNINIDLTKGVNIAKNYLDQSMSVVPNLFDFDIDGIKDYSKQFKDIQNSWKTGSTSIPSLEGGDPIELDLAITNVNSLLKEIEPQVQKEMELRKKAFEKYILAAHNLEGDLNNQILKDINSQELISGGELEQRLQYLNDEINMFETISSQLQNANSLSEDDLKNLDSKLKSMGLVERLMIGQHAAAGQILDIHQLDLKNSSKQLKLYGDISKVTAKYSDQLDQIGVEFRETINIIPYGLQRMIGIHKIGDQITDSLTAGMKSYAGSIALGESKMVAASKAAKSLGSSFATMLGPVGLVVLAIGMVVGLVKGLEDKISNVSKELGVSRATSKKMVEDSLQLVSASGNRFITEEQILEIQKKQVESNGRILDLSKQSNQELVATATNAEQAFGILATDAMDLMSTFRQLGADDSLSQRLLADVGYLSEAAGIAPNIIAKDLLEGSKELSLYFAGMPKQAAKAAIQIRRMGMSLKQAGQIADKMLNIEGFMTDMTELAAMSNGKLNLSEAFDLRMQGDIEGMTKSIMDQIGTMQNFNEMSEFTQRKLASTLGMEVADVRKSIKLKEMSNQLSSDQVAILQSNLDKVGDVNNMSVENMKLKAEELNSTKKLAVAFDKIKSILYKALVPIIESMSDALGSSTGILDAIGAGFKLIGGVIKFITPVVKGFFLPFEWAGKLITIIVGKLESLFGSADTAESSITGMNAGLSKTSQIIEYIGMAIGAAFGGNFIIKKSLTGFNAIGKAMSMLKGKSAEVGSSVAKSIASPGLFKSITDKFKSFNPFSFFKKNAEDIDLTKPITDQIESKKGLLSKLKDKIFGKSADPASPTTTTQPSTVAQDPAASKFSKISEAIKKGIDIIKGGFQTLKDFVISTVDMISQVIGKLGEGIGKFFEGMFTGLANGLNKFQPKALIGAAALVIIAGALWTTAKAVQEFNTVNWSSLAKAGIAIVGLTGVMIGLGAIMGSGVGAAAIGLGIAAFAGMSASLWLFGKALNVVGDAMVKFEPIVVSIMTGINTIVTSAFTGITNLIASLGNIDASNLLLMGPALMGIAAGLAGLGIALAAFGASSAIMGPGIAILIGASAAIWLFAKASESAASSVGVLFDSFGKIDIGQLLLLGPALMGIGAGLAALGAGSIITGLTSLFTENPFEKLEKIAILATPMSLVANSVKLLSDSLTALASILGSIDINKLNDISNNSLEINKILKVDPSTSMNSANISSPIQPVSAVNSVPAVGESYNSTSIQNQQLGQSTNNTTTQQISTAKLERIMNQLVDAFIMYANRPSYAVIDDAATKGLNNKLKGLNNR